MKKLLSATGGMLLLGIISLSTSAQAAGAAPATLAKGTRQLSTAELSAKLVGFRVELVVPPEMRWLHPVEYFYKDGKYIVYEHRDKSTGSYTIRDDVVCTKVESAAEACRFIFIDVDGLFWIAPNKVYADQFRQIRFKTIEAVGAVMSALPSSPTEWRTAPHVLTTDQLRAVVPGHSIGQSEIAPSPSYAPPVEQFRRDGTYLQLGDNSQDPGRYTLSDNMICVESESHKRLCRFLLVDEYGSIGLLQICPKGTTIECP